MTAVKISEISALSFFLSFVFALGGIGAAVALIPSLVFLGVPFKVARPAGLFTNFLSTGSASLHNIKEKIVDFKLALPIIAASVIASPFGAYASTLLPQKIVGLSFMAFLLFAGVMVYIPKKEVYKRTSGLLYPVAIGALAGFVSGFLGIGGGGLISPLLILGGYNPKAVAATTAFIVPFSSITGFFAYWKIGSVDWAVTLSASLPGFVGGYAAAYVAHRYLKPSHIKKLLGVIFFILAFKFGAKYL